MPWFKVKTWISWKKNAWEAEQVAYFSLEVVREGFSEEVIFELGYSRDAKFQKKELLIEQQMQNLEARMSLGCLRDGKNTRVAKNIAFE